MPGPDPGPGSSAKRYTVAAKVEYLHDFAQSSLPLRGFCKQHGLNTTSFCRWRKAYKAIGEAGLIARPNRRNSGGRTARVISPEERRALIEALQKLKLPQAVFAKTYGVSVASLQKWLKAYRTYGPKGLEPKQRGRKKGSGGIAMLPAPVQETIVATKRRFPFFGLRKVKDYLLRFFQVKVSAGGVRNTLERAGIEPALPFVKKRRRSADKVRRFERALPMDLWQSDITSYVLRRESRRVYLTVFLDDYSRYVVAFGLTVRQTGDLVSDCLLEGISRFSKPKEVLTDQGRQYFAWRGKTEFQKLLDREGIRHVVSRAHHPETLGKCERLWATVGKEFWERAKPQDLEDARTRLGHFISHYNHFRPHQGLDGLVPADRFFGQADAVRKEIEDQLAGNELVLALDETPRKKVFLMGQVGEQKLSLRGERGRLVIETEHGLLEAMDLEEVGNDGGSDEQDDEHEREHDPDDSDEPDYDLAAIPAIDGGAGEPLSGAGVLHDHDIAAADREPAAAAIRDDGDAVDRGAAAVDEANAEAALPGVAATGDRGAGPDRACEAGGTSEGARDLPPDPGLVARQEDEAGGGEADGTAGAAGLAVESAGPVGNDRGPPEAATPAAEGSGAVESNRPDSDALLRSGERSGGAQEGDSSSRTGSPSGESGERGAPAVSVPAEGDAVAGAETWNQGEASVTRQAAATSGQPSSETSFESECGPGSSSGVNEPASPRTMA